MPLLQDIWRALHSDYLDRSGTLTAVFFAVCLSINLHEAKPKFTLTYVEMLRKILTYLWIKQKRTSRLTKKASLCSPDKHVSLFVLGVMIVYRISVLNSSNFSLFFLSFFYLSHPSTFKLSVFNLYILEFPFCFLSY